MLFDCILRPQNQHRHFGGLLRIPPAIAPRLTLESAIGMTIA